MVNFVESTLGGEQTAEARLQQRRVCKGQVVAAIFEGLRGQAEERKVNTDSNSCIIRERWGEGRFKKC